MARDIIPSDAQYCMIGCGGVESAQHFFISCRSFNYLWPIIRSWIGFLAADPQSLLDHLIQFFYATSCFKARHSLLLLIWLLFVWVLWKERNNRIFNNLKSFIPQLLEKVKHYSYWWMKTKNVNFVFDYHCWHSSPFTCLGVR